jgi:hypothetical protein
MPCGFHIAAGVSHACAAHFSQPELVAKKRTSVMQLQASIDVNGPITFKFLKKRSNFLKHTHLTKISAIAMSYLYIVAYLLKARTVKPAEIAVSRERPCKKHVARQQIR